jgi:membrane protease YdiL (CAAX protease family)
MTRAIAARPPRMRSPAKSATAAKKNSPAEEPSQPEGYWERSAAPLTNLMFLLPPLAIYEIGTRHFVQNPILAVAMMQRFFGIFFHANARFLPPFAVIGTLIGSHIARGDPWRVQWTDLFWMGVESIVLAIPLLLLWAGAGPYLAKIPLYPGPVELSGWAIPCIGAGIFEELIFRLIILNLLSFLTLDLMQLPKWWAYGSILLISALSFSAYHYLGSENFLPITFVFRTIAGLYFAAIFLCRGFGVTCGCHASYDMIVIGLRWIR